MTKTHSDRQVRIITPDNKYLCQAAIAGNKLWVELYTLLPAPVLAKQAVADITSINLQAWSHLLVSAPNMLSGTWTVYLEGKKLTLMTSGQPAYPFDFPPASTTPPERLGQLKHLRIYNQQPATDAVVFDNFSNSCMYPQQSFATALTHWGRFNIPKACEPTMETRVVSNQGALQVTGNLGMDGNRFPDVKDNFTVEFWVNPTQPHEIDQQYPLGTGFEGTSGQHYVLYPASNGSSGGSTMGVSVGTNGISVYEHADAYMPALLVWPVTITGWTHIAIVYYDKTPSLYINGQYITSGAQSPKLFVNPGSNISSGPYGFMQGGVDEVRIWAKARTGIEISNSFKSSVSAASAGLIAYWPFSKQDGVDLADLTCNEHIISPEPAGYTWNTTSLPNDLKDIVPVEYAIRNYYPSHKLLTSYAYNSTGQVIQQKSPDGGESYFWYDRLSRLIGSQNEEQRSKGNVYSYTMYEPVLGRIVEVGEKMNNLPLLGTPGFVHNEQTIETFNSNGTRSQITKTIYDAKPTMGAGIEIGLTQENLRKRVSASFFKESPNSPVLNASYYDYDLLGNVKTLYQQIEGLSLRRIDYEYDLVSGKVNLVRYQQGQNDQFYYIYKYDAENRLTEARTDIDWDGCEDANSHLNAYYKYYLHGPLARLELGGPEKVQGIDYAYTLQGWLKGVNGDKLRPVDDIGEDGHTGNTDIPKDVFAFSLGYYNGDYKPISGDVKAFSLKFEPKPGDLTGKELFNGNISHTTLAISRFRNGDPAGYSYGYDQLNRLIKMRYHLLTATTTNWNSSTIRNAYKEDVAYDANGNIKTYKRNGTNPGNVDMDMDNLVYHYNEATDPVSGLPYLVNNRLRHVKDDPTLAGNYTEDIDSQPDNNYEYDKIGNLTKEGGDIITWTVYGKIKSVSNSNRSIMYSYDAAGNRVRKQVTVGSDVTTTWYVRDAQGNVLGLYSQKNTGPLKWKEQHLYGSSRIGIWQPDVEIATANGTTAWTTVGNRAYELTNHLGNVLAVITDKRIPVSGGLFEAEVPTAHDYYPFGMQMPGRSIDAPDCQEVVQDLRELTASSDLNAGAVQNGADVNHNGVRWAPMTPTSTITLYNQAIKCENGGGSSDGVVAIVPGSLVETNTTYVIEFDIIDKSPTIAYFNCQAHTPTGDPYRVVTRKTGLGHYAITFTTPASLPQSSYIRLRITSNQVGVGTWFVVDNFICRKYTVVNQIQEIATDFNSAVMNGVNVVSDGMEWTPFNSSTSSLSVIGTADKKILVTCTNVNESFLRSEIDLAGGRDYLLRFTMAQDLADKRLGMRIHARTGGVWAVTETQGLIYTGSGNYMINFTHPAGADKIRVEYYRSNGGQTYDGYNVPYTIDNFSITRIEPIAQQTTTVCDPNADPSGENGIYRYGFNGKEKDNEVKGNGTQYDYGFRIYNPMIGRFLSVDPLTQSYPWYTPYQFAGNKPIIAIDVDGLEEFVKTQWHDVNGKIYRTVLEYDEKADPFTGSGIHVIHKYHDSKGYLYAESHGMESLKGLDFLNSPLYANARGKAEFDAEKHFNPFFAQKPNDYSKESMTGALYHEFFAGTGSENTVIYGGKMVEDIKEMSSVKDIIEEAMIIWKSDGKIDVGEKFSKFHKMTKGEGATDLWIPGFTWGVKNGGPNNPFWSTQHFLGSYFLTLEVMEDGNTVMFTLYDSKTQESTTDHKMGNNSIDRSDNSIVPNSSTYQRYIWTMPYESIRIRPWTEEPNADIRPVMKR